MKNFKNQIAIQLEIQAKSLLGYDDQPINTIFDADAIECGNFAEVMILLLRIKSSYRSDNSIDAFAKMCAPYIGAKGLDLDETIAVSLYQEFCDFYKKIKLNDA